MVSLQNKAKLNKKAPTLPLSSHQIDGKPWGEHTQQQNAWGYESRTAKEKPQIFSVVEMFMKKPYIRTGQTSQQLGSRPSVVA